MNKDFAQKSKVVARAVRRLHFTGTHLTKVPTEEACRLLLSNYIFLVEDLHPENSTCDYCRTILGRLLAYGEVEVYESLSEVKVLSVAFRNNLTDTLDDAFRTVSEFKPQTPLAQAIRTIVLDILNDARGSMDMGYQARAVRSALTVLDALDRPSWGLDFPDECEEFIEFDRTLDDSHTTCWWVPHGSCHAFSEREIEALLRVLIQEILPPPTIVMPVGKFSGGAKNEVRRGTPASMQCSYVPETFPSIFGKFLYVPGAFQGSIPRVCDILFVNKSARSNRTIGKEPVVLAFCQQSVRQALLHSVRHGPLNAHIDFHNPPNGELARLGSENCRYATIDLSSASDSVSFHRHVCRVMKGSEWLPLLAATRSTHYRLNGVVRVAKKFAQMGSSVTFPFMTILLAAVCELAARYNRGHDHGYRFLVYGDDIVVPEDLYDDVVCILETLGFKVNTTKSFHGLKCKFRESCGVEAWKGYDVTPFRYSRKTCEIFDHLSAFPSRPSRAAVASSLSGLCALLNTLYLRGHRLARRHLMTVFSENLKYVRRTSDPGECTLPLEAWRFDEDSASYGLSLLTPESSCTNYNLRFRWNIDYQIWQSCAIDLVTVKQGSRVGDSEAYTAWNYQFSHYDEIGVSVDRVARRATQVRLGRTWRVDSSTRVVRP
jgi:hypothetical protein